MTIFPDNPGLETYFQGLLQKLDREGRLRTIKELGETMITTIVDETQLLGLPGELEWVPILDVQVDDSYQRTLSRYQVNRIKREFDPDLLGVLLISERPDGERFVLDGQHRIAALLEMGHEHERVPAMVYHHLSVETEAKIFALANRNRLYLAPPYAFRARLLAGDKDAHAIVNAVAAHGYHLNYWKNIPGQEKGMSRPEGMITCIGEVESMYRDYSDPEMLNKVLKICAGAWGGEVVGLGANVLRGLAIMFYNFETTMDQERLLEILTKTTPIRLVNEARDLASAGSPMAVTQILIKKYNYHLGHKGRLPTTGLRKSNQRRG